MKNKSWLTLVCVFVSILAFVGCEESEGVNEYSNWKEKNDTYIDSIAKVARANADGTWKVYKAWNLPPDMDIVASYNNQNYVYVKVEQTGTGTIAPIFSDSVSVSYRGTLITGAMFDETYTAKELDPETAGRVTMRLTGTVTGWTTALQYMHIGDLWSVYIPWNLGYGSTGSGSVLGYSDLVFKMYLADINPPYERKQ